MNPQDPKFDAWLDEQLRDVSLPVGMLNRLRRVALTDDDLDEELRDVVMPVYLHRRLERIADRPIRALRLADLALAASLVIGIGLSYAGAVAGFLWATCPAPGLPPKLDYLRVELVSAADRRPPELMMSVEPGLGQERNVNAQAGPAAWQPRITLSRYEKPTDGPVAKMIRDLIPSYGGANEHILWNVPPGKWGEKYFTSHKRFDELPDLKWVAGLVPQGIPAPLVPGYPLAFLCETGFHPFVSPAAHPELQTTLIPLAANTSSYELTRRYLENGRLPPRGKLRTEEFLAAIDYGFPRPKRGVVGLFVAAGPSPFRNGLQLLQFGVQARQVDHVERPPTHLTLAVDVSSSMRWGGRLEMVRRAMDQLTRQLGPADRVSLVSFSENADVLIEDVGCKEADQFRAAVATLTCQGSTNLGAGLRAAYAVTHHIAGDSTPRTRVVLLTDGLTELDLATANRIENRLTEAAGCGILLHVIDLRQDQEGMPDPQFLSFTKAGKGHLHRATNVDQVRWALLEVLAGRSQLVASDVRLTVTFNRKTVQAYRLFGHEPNRIVGLEIVHPETDFRSGQSGTALLELSLKPTGGKEIAVAELCWRDPASGQSHRVTRKINRDQFDCSPGSLPLSLQEAAIVAQTAEILRESPFTPGPTSVALRQVLESVQRVDSRLYQRPTFADFVRLVGQADSAKPYRGRGRR